MINMGRFRRAALRQYMGVFNTGSEQELFDEYVGEILERQGITYPHDPRSVYDPAQLYEALELYSPLYNKRVAWDQHLRHGFNVALSIFGRRGEALKALREPTDLINSVKLDKNSGLPFLVKKKQVIQYGLDRLSQVIRGTKAANPCVAFKRTQAGNKTRLVWGYPIEMTFCEAQFARPLIDKFLCLETPMAFGIPKAYLGPRISLDIVDQGVVHCLDYSKFDQTVPSLLIFKAFDILKTWFESEDTDQLGWDKMVRYFVYTPIVMPDGCLYTGKDHGIPSGSYFTQLIDSIVNVMVIFAALHEMRVDLPRRRLLVLGDDSIFSVSKEINLDLLRETLNKFNIRLNIEKCFIGEAHFLGVYWRKAMPRLELHKLAAKATQPETFRKYSGQTKSERQLEALFVLASFATVAIDGWKLLPLIHDVFGTVSRIHGGFKLEHLTGSDRFTLEYAEFSRAGPGFMAEKLSDSRDRKSVV